ncbi:hypothetical protein J6590_031438 [Homalodisca vitripennis]|nr:hypothetical protein J6590_031438 [Homalodisca vitripennis]
MTWGVLGAPCCAIGTALHTLSPNAAPRCESRSYLQRHLDNGLSYGQRGVFLYLLVLWIKCSGINLVDSGRYNGQFFTGEELNTTKNLTLRRSALTLGNCYTINASRRQQRSGESQHDQASTRSIVSATVTGSYHHVLNERRCGGVNNWLRVAGASEGHSRQFWRLSDSPPPPGRRNWFPIRTGSGAGHWSLVAAFLLSTRNYTRYTAAHYVLRNLSPPTATTNTNTHAHIVSPETYTDILPLRRHRKV